MKIIVRDNFDYDYENIVCENIKVERVAEALCGFLNLTESKDFYFEVVSDDYVLRQDRGD